MNSSYIDILTTKIKEKNIEIVSFDFFDTLMSRRVPHPRDVFWVLGKRLISSGILNLEVSPERFQALRIRAEERAREEGATKEIGIRDIYEQFPTGFFSVELNEVIRMEVETEKEFLFPSADMIDAIKLAHGRGKKIIVVSDIYLEAKHLKEFWGNATPGVDIKFFTSSEHRVGKYDNLFNIVIKKLKCKPDAILHSGDNYVSDVEVPSSKGINTCFLPHGSHSFWTIFNDEVPSANHLSERVCSINGDLGLTALRCKVMLHRSAREIDENGYVQYGAKVLGPVFSPFVHWVRSAALSQQVNVVLPLMREGFMIDKLLSTYPDIASRPAYLSRRVLFQAGLVKADRPMLEALKFGNLQSSVSEYLELIGLYRSDAKELTPLLNKYISDPVVYEELINKITSSPTLMSKIKGRASDVRQGVIAHLMSLLLRDGKLPSKVALVDVGWNATIQKLLQNILREEGIDIQLLGLYMMTTPGVNNLVFEGVIAQGFYVDGGLPAADFMSLSRTLEIVEQSCSPPHGSVLCHDLRTGDPILKPDLIPAVQRADIYDLQEGIILFNSVYRRNVDVDVPAGALMELGNKYRSILRRAMLSPSAEEALLFAHWKHDDNLASGSVMPIIGTEQARAFTRYKTMQQYMDTPMGELYWPAGALALNDPDRSSLLAIATTHRLPLSSFDTDTKLSSEMAADTMVDHSAQITFSEKDHQPLYRNLSNKSYLKFTVRTEDNPILRWTPMAKSFDLRVDFLTFTHLSDIGALTQHRIEGDKLIHGSIAVGMEQYDIASWRGRAAGSAFYFKDLRSFGITGPGTLTVEVACELTPIEESMESRSAIDEFSVSIDHVVEYGHCVVEAFNGSVIEKGQNSFHSADGVIGFAGWMVSPNFKNINGDFFMRITNPVGKTKFVKMSATRRQDVIQHLKEAGRELQENIGFSLSGYRLPAGSYTATVVQKGLTAFLVGKDSWKISVEGVNQ